MRRTHSFRNSSSNNPHYNTSPTLENKQMIASLEALRRLRVRGGKDVRKAQRTGAATHFQIEITPQNYQDIVLDLGIPERYSSSPQVVRSFFAEKFNAQTDGDTVVFSIGVFSTNWHGSLR